MNKKGQIAMISTIITLVISVLLLSLVAFPQWRTTTSAQSDTDVLTAHVLGSGNTTTTLTNTDLVTDGVSIAGLTTANYTVDYDTAIVEIDNATANGTYTASYTYYAAGYIESSSTRAFAAIVILFLIVGLVAGAFRMFGLL